MFVCGSKKNIVSLNSQTGYNSTVSLNFKEAKNVCGFMLRIVINALLLFLVIAELPGVFVDTLGGMLLAVAIVGIANAAVRPILMLTASPLNCLNLGGVTLFLNILTLMIVTNVLPGFQIKGMTSPVIGVLFITICSFTLSKVIADR